MYRYAAGIVLASLLALNAPARRAEGAEFTLRLAAINAKTTLSFTDFLVPLKQAIEQESGKRIEVQLGGLGDYGKPSELLGLLENGKIEIASTVPGYHGERFKRTSVFDLPMLFDTAEQGTYASWQVYEEGLIASEFQGYKVLALFPVTPYGIFTNIPVANLHDLRGLRVRASNLTAGQAFNRLAMISLGLTADAMGPSLSQNLIDAVSYSYDAASASPGDNGKMLIEQLKYLVDARFTGGMSMIIMREAAYTQLPPDLRAVIDRHTGRDFSLRGAKLRDQWEVAARARIEQQGGHVFVSLTPDERAEMQRRVQPVLDDWVATLGAQGIDGKALLERVRAIVKEHPAS
jgi:TRAP-type C4-dicarboxylate transport system substrate-binding protein